MLTGTNCEARILPGESHYTPCWWYQINQSQKLWGAWISKKKTREIRSTSQNTQMRSQEARMVALVWGTSRPINLRSLGSKQKCTQSAICIWAKNWGLKQISPERRYNIIVYTLHHTNFKRKNIHCRNIQWVNDWHVLTYVYAQNHRATGWLTIASASIAYLCPLKYMYTFCMHQTK
jgi:hypothetical protein